MKSLILKGDAVAYFGFQGQEECQRDVRLDLQQREKERGKEKEAPALQEWSRRRRRLEGKEAGWE